jgi:peptidase inhibitor I9
MPDSPTRGFRRAGTAAIVAAFAAIAAALLVTLPAAGASGGQPQHTYIVQMLADPVVAYTGGVPGLAATKPAKGQKIDPTSNDVVKYVGYLSSRHDAALAKVGGGEKLYDYAYSYDGFAAKLTDGQATKLESQSGVLAVTKDELQTADTSSTPSFLGLDAAGGLWASAPARTSSSASSTRASGPRARASVTAMRAGSSSTSRSRASMASASRPRSSLTARGMPTSATRSWSPRGTSTPRGAATPKSTPSARGSSPPRATTTATGRTRRPRPAGTTAFRPPAPPQRSAP